MFFLKAVNEAEWSVSLPDKAPLITRCCSGVTDPSRNVITHTCPLFPLVSICIYVPFGFHWGVDYCYNVRWCVWVPVLCVLAFVPKWIEQVITGPVPCVNQCPRVLFIQGTPHTFVWGSTTCLVTCLFGICPRALTRHAVIWWNNNPYCAFLRLSPDPFIPTWHWPRGLVNVDLFKGVTHIGYEKGDHTLVQNSWCSHARFNVACLEARLEVI